MKSPFYFFEETKNLFYLSILFIIFLSLIFSAVFTLIVKHNKILPIFINIPLIFSVFEYLISVIFYGFPWITFSLILSAEENFNFIFKNFGTFMSSYIIIQLFCLPYVFLTSSFLQRNSLFYFIFIIATFIFVILYNFVSKERIDIAKEKIDLEIFQLNNKNFFTYTNINENYEKIIEYISNSEADIMIFAENDYPYLIDDNKLDILKSYLKTNQTLIIGGTRKENNNYFNTLVHLDNDNIFYFDKKILVPFGEFIPLRKYLSFLEPIAGKIDFSKGEKKRIISLKSDFTYIPIICYEIIYYWKIINKINQNSEFIVNITNDNWFGKFLGPYQHFYLTKIRASEFNKPIIRVSNNGISAIISQNGKVLVRTNLNENKVIRYNMTINNSKNFYKTHYFLNVYFFIICLILFLFNLKTKK